MRRIIPKGQEAKRRKRNQVIVSLMLISVMFFSVLGFAFSSFSFSGKQNIDNSNPNSINYNGFEFREQSGFWVLNKEGINFIFRNNPYEVARINSEINPLSNYLEKPLYIYSESIEAESEIQTNLFQFVKEIENACLEKCNENEQLPIRSCEDNFIII
ncbi:MAG: hypothetical protein IIA85_03580, partial [Nanoarchaeota archaeon]|nr:hypothetical protein [Nanoarchaeota archaeon]